MPPPLSTPWRKINPTIKIIAASGHYLQNNSDTDFHLKTADVLKNTFTVEKLLTTVDEVLMGGLKSDNLPAATR